MPLSHLNDAPLDARAPIPAHVQEYLDYLAGLIEDTEVYTFAVSTLTGIESTIRASRRVTQGQRDAVRNIVNGAEEGRRRRETRTTSRRYEGFGR